MSEMVERVARSLCLTNGLDPDDMTDVDDVGGPLWLLFRNDATQAIAAMREPTDWMELMGTQAWLCERGMEDRSRACWQAMIDAALGGAGSEPSCESPHDTEDRQDDTPDESKVKLAIAAFRLWSWLPLPTAVPRRRI